MPDEILLVVNNNSPESRAVSDYYMKLRGIPRGNIVTVSVPDTDAISRDDFRKRIEIPLNRSLKMPGWAVKIRCLLLTTGIPLRIKATAMSHRERQEKDELMEMLKAIDNIISSPKVARDEKDRLKAEKKRIQKRLPEITHEDQVASVDSELTLVRLSGNYPLEWWIKNPLYVLNRRGNKRIRPEDIIMVARLDGPDFKTIRRMIDDAIYAESHGLHGAAYFDCRYPELPRKKLSAYQQYDQSLRDAAAFVRGLGCMRTVVDTSEALFKPGRCPNAALYCGWYSLSRYVDAFDWARGAVAYHIASGECVTLRGTGRGWCKMLLKDGVAVTLGPVAEPYLQAFPPPHLFFRLLFDSRLTLAEVYFLSCPMLSWRMVLLGDPLYRPFRIRTGFTNKYFFRQYGLTLRKGVGP